MRLFKIAQAVPRSMVPNRNTPYYYIRRSLDSTSASGGKEYMYTVYGYDNNNQIGNGTGSYAVIGWHGSVNQSSPLTKAQWKGSFSSFDSARRMADSLHRERVTDLRKHYQTEEDGIHSYYSTRIIGSNQIDNPPGSQPNIPPPLQSPPRRSTPSPTITTPSTPSIRLPQERIPNADSVYIWKIVINNDRNNRFVVLVYDYRDGWYSAVEWYAPNDNASYRIHPKLLTQDRSAAVSMAARLVSEKVERGGWREMFIANLPPELGQNRVGSESATPTTPTTPASPPVSSPIVPTQSPPAPLSEEAREYLDLFSNRKDTWYKMAQASLKNK